MKLSFKKVTYSNTEYIVKYKFYIRTKYFRFRELDSEKNPVLCKYPCPGWENIRHFFQEL